MRIRWFQGLDAPRQVDSLDPIFAALNAQRERAMPETTDTIVEALDAFAGELVKNDATQRVEGLAFLATWLKRTNVETLLRRNFGDKVAALDGFIEDRGQFLRAQPRGIVTMWMAGNVPTLPFFSVVPALLTRNAAIVKLPSSDFATSMALAHVLGKTEAGSHILERVAFIGFDRTERKLNEELSLRSDAKVVWGGQAAVDEISGLPRAAHCVELIFGPRYSGGVIDRLRIEDPKELDQVAGAFVRDTAIFDQRACSSPQTIFVETSPTRSLRDVAAAFARHFERLPPKPDQDAFTTMQITNARAEWGMHEDRDVIASSDPNWTICLDREVRFKDAVQSRTIFLTEVGSIFDVMPLLDQHVQTIGIAIADQATALRFAELATRRGVDRCVRPGLMNGYESPWDGHLVLADLVRWVTAKV